MITRTSLTRVSNTAFPLRRSVISSDKAYPLYASRDNRDLYIALLDDDYYTATKVVSNISSKSALNAAFFRNVWSAHDDLLFFN